MSTGDVLPLDYKPPDPADDSHRTRQAVFALTAGFLGWTLDAFDYFLVIISAPLITKEFGFGTDDSQVQKAVFLTLVFRPVGAFIFGLLADRYGRRLPMIADLIFYSIVEVATGFAPTFTTFLILRAFFGIGMGGEWGVGASLVMEKVPAKWRGVISGLLQEGYAFGFLLAAVAGHFILPRYGWRPLFFLGGIPAVLALFVRFGITESEVWVKNKAESWSNLGSAIASNWKLLIYMAILMAGMNFSSHGTQDTYTNMLHRDRGLDAAVYSNVVIVTMIGAIIGGIIFGLLSDRLGRRVMMITAFCGAILVIPLWAFSHTLPLMMLGGFLMQFFVQGAWGIIPAHINELAPDNVRGFLPGFAYQCGNLLAASVGFFESKLAAHYNGYAKPMAACACVIFIFAIVVTAIGKERHGLVFGSDKQAA